MRSFVNGMMALAFVVAVPAIASAAKCTDAAAVAAARAAADAECSCASATNHGQYVSCVAAVAKERADNGQLPSECKGEVVRCASKSTCGKEGAVTCCRVDRRGKTKCSIKKSADKCKAPKGGSASVGTSPSCCDACEGGTTTTTGAPTTTTAAPTTTTAAPTTTTAAPTTTTAAPTTTTLPGSPSSAFLDANR